MALFSIFSLFIVFLPLIFSCLVMLAILGLKIYLIHDATQRDFAGNDTILLMTALVVVFLPIIFAIPVYYLVIAEKYPKK